MINDYKLCHIPLTSYFILPIYIPQHNTNILSYYESLIIFMLDKYYIHIQPFVHNENVEHYFQRPYDWI